VDFLLVLIELFFSLAVTATSEHGVGAVARFPSEGALLSKKLCYKLFLCENYQHKSCNF